MMAKLPNKHHNLCEILSLNLLWYMNKLKNLHYRLTSTSIILKKNEAIDQIVAKYAKNIFEHVKIV